nr:MULTISPECIES: septum site-determining protein MinD [Halorhodospira]
MRPSENSNHDGGARVSRIVVITSGKGGVGKTTTAASLAAGLARAGHRTAVVDFDVGLRNLDLVMGCERRVVFDFVNVINGDARLNQALIKDKRLSNLSILPASQTRDKDALTPDGVERVLDELRAEFDYIICDSPAGIERGAHLASYHADDAIVVTNPEVSSVRDSDRVLGLLASRTRRAEQGDDPVREHLLLTRYDAQRVKKGDMLSVEDVQEILAINLLGVIPESQSVLNASNAGIPVVLEEGEDAGQAYDDAIARYLGEDRPHRFLQAERRGLFGRMFGG